MYLIPRAWYVFFLSLIDVGLAPSPGPSPSAPSVLQERQGVPARWGDPACGIPTAKPPTVRESREPGPPLEPGPLAPCPSQRGAEGGEGSRPEGGVPARRGVGVPARGILRPIRCQAAWEYHEPGPPNEPGPLAFSQCCLPHTSPGGPAWRIAKRVTGGWGKREGRWGGRCCGLREGYTGRRVKQARFGKLVLLQLNRAFLTPKKPILGHIALRFQQIGALAPKTHKAPHRTKRASRPFVAQK